MPSEFARRAKGPPCGLPSGPRPAPKPAAKSKCPPNQLALRYLRGWPRSPTGWKASGFSGGLNLRGRKGCNHGWAAYARLAKKGTVSTKLVGSGALFLRRQQICGHQSNGCPVFSIVLNIVEQYIHYTS